MLQEEYPLLESFLFEAIFIPPGVESPSRDIIQLPELQIYIEDFGKADDLALVAEVEGRIVGAVWTRIMEDFGHIDDETPSLSISLLPAFRGQGIGTALMKEKLNLLKEQGYHQVSLSVQKANDARLLYLKLGLEIVQEYEEDLLMVYQLS